MDTLGCTDQTFVPPFQPLHAPVLVAAAPPEGGGHWLLLLGGSSIPGPGEARACKGWATKKSRKNRA